MTKDQYEIADFAGGCFWNVEDVFMNVPGVVKTEVGYEGGHVKNPTYEMVCSLATGHAETARVTFDPTKISYEQLIEIFFRSHDPTQLNRQGLDVGENYRSVVFYHNQQQKRIAERVVKELNTGEFAERVVTEIKPAKGYYRAEDYHQQYHAKQRQ